MCIETYIQSKTLLPNMHKYASKLQHSITMVTQFFEADSEFHLHFYIADVHFYTVDTEVGQEITQCHVPGWHRWASHLLKFILKSVKL